MAQRFIDTPVGRLKLITQDGALVRVAWTAETDRESESPDPLLDRLTAQLAAYFAGEAQEFSVPLRPAGSAFQLAVWQAMCRIPSGQTATYGELAREVDGEPRAVGQACGANPIPIVIPCHRVLAAVGQLGGYSGAGGLETKRRLLELEGALPPSLF